jgi:hypothetical protein
MNTHADPVNWQLDVDAGKLGIRQDETWSAAWEESQTLVCEERDEVM